MAKTFLEIDHERCDPAKWTLDDVQTFAHFLRFADLADMQKLNRLGVRLVLSEKLEPLGGGMQFVGYLKPDELGKPVWDEPTEDVGEAYCHEVPEVAPLVPVYVAPLKYAGKFYEGDEDHADEAFEIFETIDEAEKLAAIYRPGAGGGE